jgi:hypothetical protein
MTESTNELQVEPVATVDELSDASFRPSVSPGTEHTVQEYMRAAALTHEENKRNRELINSLHIHAAEHTQIAASAIEQRDESRRVATNATTRADYAEKRLVTFLTHLSVIAQSITTLMREVGESDYVNHGYTPRSARAQSAGIAAVESALTQLANSPVRARESIARLGDGNGSRGHGSDDGDHVDEVPDFLVRQQ